jgi:hypothetical protein
MPAKRTAPKPKKTDDDDKKTRAQKDAIAVAALRKKIADESVLKPGEKMEPWRAGRWAMSRDTDDRIIATKDTKNAVGEVIVKKGEEIVVPQPMRSQALMAIVLHADMETGECNPSHRRVAALIGCSLRQAERHVRELKKNYIATEAVYDERGRQAPNRYRLRWGEADMAVSRGADTAVSEGADMAVTGEADMAMATGAGVATSSAIDRIEQPENVHVELPSDLPQELSDELPGHSHGKSIEQNHESPFPQATTALQEDNHHSPQSSRTSKRGADIAVSSSPRPASTTDREFANIVAMLRREHPDEARRFFGASAASWGFTFDADGQMATWPSWFEHNVLEVIA